MISHSQSIPRQNDPQGSSHKNIGDPHEVRLVDETETKRMRKSNFNRFKKFVFSQPNSDKEILDKKIISKFISVLKQKAYIYHDCFFNSLQKEILTEKYMTLPNNTFTNNGNKNQIILDFSFYFIWDLLNLFQIIILLFWIIFKIAFNSTNQYLTQVIFILFIVLDIFICLISPYLQKGYMILNKIDVIRNSIPCTIIINLIYSVSTTILLLQDNNDEILLILYAFQLISSFAKLNKIQNKLSDFTSLNFELLVNIGQLVFLLHLSSCIWHIIGINDENSWIYKNNLDESDKITRYCHAFFYSISLLFNVGSSNIIITTNTELIFSSVLIFLSIWICCLILLQLNQYLKHFYEQQLDIFKEMETINAFLNRRKVPFLIKCKVRNYIKYMFQKQKRNDYEIQNILQSLRPDLKEELIL
ncbi:unnamed protein product (macronuclear) [Paramecium tetraurelia]|uniref:Ion transport domain-containing protein n=1 Tax=Paramecium tetraurelia TaxID=5888 RepID=A0DNS4_PARTE|nr:uncharacterized protein GSPATT00018887001 [Paramecium tetraurelia]CAK84691.1 unnamed protein product [Paramecium tetraurelia]|eukprot:XP_001452088.1 hypothetical protein (macronuclear) [Paramecium tetraurelia strain d4-2]